MVVSAAEGSTQHARVKAGNMVMIAGTAFMLHMRVLAA
jgi:hypothetical protein